MKILHINCSDSGSTGEIIRGICSESKHRGWDSVFVFPRRRRAANPDIREYATSMPLEQGIYRRIYYLFGLHYGFAPLSTGKILRIIRKEQPDIVHLHSINCATVNIYRLVSYLKQKKIATVITNHAEFFYTGNCPHAYECEKWKTGCGKCPDLFAASESKLFDRTHTAWRKMQQAFSGYEKLQVVSVSPWINDRSKQSPILNRFPHHTILNGVNTNVFTYSSMDDARNRLGLSLPEKILLHVTANFSNRLEDNKGGRFIIDLARRLEHKDVRVIVIGKHDDLQELPSNLTLLGEIKDQKLLAQYYCAADLCAVASKRETFGMTVAEALCCGTPVVGFASGGSDSIALPAYTQFVPFGDIDTLENAICNRWINYKRENEQEKIPKLATAFYSSQIMAQKYCDLYQSCLEEGERNENSDIFKRI